MCVPAALHGEGGVEKKRQERKGERESKKKHKALSSENADRLTGLLRPTQTHGDGAGERGKGGEELGKEMEGKLERTHQRTRIKASRHLVVSKMNSSRVLSSV